MTHSPQNVAVRSTRIMAVILVIAALFFARSILIPTVLAILLTLLLDPLVRLLERIGLHRVIAVALTVLMLVASAGFIGVLVGQQVIDLSMQLPDYQDNLRKKVHDLRVSGQMRIARITGALRELNEELSATRP